MKTWDRAWDKKWAQIRSVLKRLADEEFNGYVPETPAAAFTAGRIVEAFGHGETFAVVASRFRISEQRAEDIVRRLGRTRRA